MDDEFNVRIFTSSVVMEVETGDSLTTELRMKIRCDVVSD